MATEVFYNDRDNTIDLLLKKDGAAQDLSAITKIILKVGTAKTITDESSTAWPIKWTGLGTTGKIQMQLGDQEIPVDVYYCTLILFDATNDNGVVWADDLKISAKSG